jgi:hypothetical protein
LHVSSAVLSTSQLIVKKIKCSNASFKSDTTATAPSENDNKAFHCLKDFQDWVDFFQSIERNSLLLKGSRKHFTLKVEMPFISHGACPDETTVEIFNIVIKFLYQVSMYIRIVIKKLQASY